MKKTRKVSNKNTKSNSTSTYTPVSENIYNDGRSYRVRVSVNGETVSINTQSKKEAFRIRKQLFELRGNIA